MVASVVRLPRASTLACTALAAALSLLSLAAADDTIRVWRVGSPHTGDTPDTRVPFMLAQEAASRGWRLSIEAFPARGFATMFRDAVARGEAPDLLVFDNYGVIEGITTELGTFEGIGEDPALRTALVRVTGAFDDLLGPLRGWTYLFRSSAHHQMARTFALRPPACVNGLGGPAAAGDLLEVVPKIATAYLEGDAAALQTYSDPDRLPPGPSTRGSASVGMVRSCGVWANDRLAFASVNAVTESEASLGCTPALLVLRKHSAQWRLLAAARDPISNGAFVKALPQVAASLESDRHSDTLVGPATLLSPPPGVYPNPSAGERFGRFRWWSSPSQDVVTEVIEFAYDDDARLFARPALPGARGEISAGELWTTRRAWNWRVWSISRDGDVVFSEARDFVH